MKHSNKTVACENASTRKRKYESAGMENASTENASTMQTFSQIKKLR